MPAQTFLWAVLLYTPVTSEPTSVPALLSSGDIQEAVTRIAAGSTGAVHIVDCHGNYDFVTIQGAIDAAADGDIVVVLPNTCTPQGHYFENIDFLGKAIHVRSIAPDDPEVVAGTVINGGQQGTVVDFHSGEGLDSILEGLTLTNGTMGVFCRSASSPTIRGCHIRDNGPTDNGAGVQARSFSHPAILGCRITGNVAELTGGGMFLALSNATIDGCLIAGNSAGSRGGGVYTSPCAISACGVNLRGCTIVDNHAAVQGGGLWMNQGDPHVLNGNIWGNTSGEGSGVYVGTVNYADQPPRIRYCDLQSLDGPGTVILEGGNFEANPKFVDPDGGDYHLASDSPCIDNGDPQAVADDGDVDLDGNPRLQHCRMDLGAFEHSGFVDCNDNALADACEVLDGTVVDDNGNGRPDACEISLYADCHTCPAVGSGTREDPYCSIQQAVDAALPGDTVVIMPSSGCLGDAYFENIRFIGRPITVRGSDPQSPTVVAATVLNGSLVEAPTVALHLGESATLAGVTITGGSGTTDVDFVSPVDPEFNPDLGFPHLGGGVLVHRSALTLQHAHITEITAHSGAAVAIKDGSLAMTNSDVSANTGIFEFAPPGGHVARMRGAVFALDSNLTLSHCRLVDNVMDGLNANASSGGIGVGVTFGVSPQALGPAALDIAGCRVQGNHMVNIGAQTLLSWGGGIAAFFFEGQPGQFSVRNSVIATNTSPAIPGIGLTADPQAEVSALIQGCTIAGNTAISGTFAAALQVFDVETTLAHSVVRLNTPVSLTDLADVTVRYSNVATSEGRPLPGEGNIDSDALFVNPAGGNYHLLPGSPCIDAGDPEFVPVPDETDIDGDPRVLGKRIDMGADEFNADCNANGTPDAGDITAGESADCNANGIPDECIDLETDHDGNTIPDDCEDCPADINGDGDVGPADLAALLGAWGPNPGHAADLNQDGTVDPADLAILLGAWGDCSGA